MSSSPKKALPKLRLLLVVFLFFVVVEVLVHDEPGSALGFKVDFSNVRTYYADGKENQPTDCPHGNDGTCPSD